MKFYASDTEDNSIELTRKIGKPKMLYGYTFDGLQYYRYENLDQFYTPFDGVKGKQVVFFLNAEYDIGNIFRKDLGELEITYIKSRFIMARIAGTRIYIYDSLNHWKVSLKKMGEIVGLPKLEMNLDDERYCKRDCEILYRFIEIQSSLYAEYNSKFKATLAGNSIDIWTKNFTKNHYWQKYFSDSVKNKFRKSYYGGRVEIFKTGIQKKRGKPIYVFDVNSLFPYCMKKFAYPDLKTFVPQFNIDKTGITECEVFSDMTIPVLPYRYIKGGEQKLIFPNGRFKGTWTNAELEYFTKKGGKINKIISGYHFENNIRPFVNFVDHFYRKRQETTEDSENYFYKIILNALYGKFAQGGSIQVLKSGTFNEHSSGVIMYDHKDKIYMLETEHINAALYSNIIWSSYVTSYARIVLHKLLIQNEKDLIYCDTDSIFTYDKNFNTSNKLGKLKLESISHSGLFLLPKLYFLFNEKAELEKAANKGFPVSSDNMFRFLYESGFSVRRKPVRLRLALKRGLEFNSWIFLLKFIKTTYNKRTVIDDNGNTVPIVINTIN